VEFLPHLLQKSNICEKLHKQIRTTSILSDANLNFSLVVQIRTTSILSDAKHILMKLNIVVIAGGFRRKNRD
jgi:hypothetical protein